MAFDPKSVSKIKVFHDSWMEGGGSWFGQEYVPVIQSRYPGRRFQKCYEWCSGPGFIGFSLLTNNICETLCLSDIYDMAIEKSVRQTVEYHGLQDRVTSYVTGTLANLPSYEQFDLVVANPPHYLECPGDANYQRIAVDQDWQAHQDFFQHIGQHITADSIILLQENHAGSLKREEDFRPFIESNGLEITDVMISPNYYDPNGPTQIYYIEIRLAK
jgi:methylase of polypeptide subunit release factors